MLLIKWLEYLKEQMNKIPIWLVCDAIPTNKWGTQFSILSSNIVSSTKATRVHIFSSVTGSH
jgi:hypothetical protein